MKFIADLHIHSKYSRACSKDLDIAHMEKWAKIKGLDLLGTGDFTHPKWIEELKSSLTETEKDSGLFQTASGFKFVLQTELSLIYTQEHGRKIHNVVIAPSFQAVDEITQALLKRGRVDYDGRPIFKIPCPEFVEMMKSIDNRIQVIPAHCLLPDELVHINNFIKKIKDIKENDMVLTHKGRFRKVKKIYVRYYNGEVLNVIPWYFSEGINVTPEHPFLIIKTFKNCSWTKGLICKPTASHMRICYSNAYKKYVPQWVPAEFLEKGDVILYPKITKIKDINHIKINNVDIPVTKEFCRLIGYYLAEGYTNNRDALFFSFHSNEKEYQKEVSQIMHSLFSIEPKQGKTKGDLVFYSKKVYQIFQKLFYVAEPYKANNKCIPSWGLLLPFDKQRELLRGWWRGDKGYTVSRILANQMKLICLRMDIIPNMGIDSVESYEKRGKHFINNRKIHSKHKLVDMHRLSFLDRNNELLKDPAFKLCFAKRDINHGWSDKNYIYIPIRKIKKNTFKGNVYNLEVETDNSYVAEYATVHNCWTPWFGLYGANGGFDSIKECFQDQMKNVHAIETGISSDPPMNWRVKELDNINIVSFSDIHSFWPWRLGREATVFDIEPNFNSLAKALETGKGLTETIEVNPNLGKYHLTGHRACNVCLFPDEAKKLNNLCPACGKTLTVGVDQRIEELANRPLGYKPDNAKPFSSLIPLSELLAKFHGKAVASKKIWEEYNKLVNENKNEFDVLLKMPISEIAEKTSQEFADILEQNRIGKIEVKGGYDGVYGVPLLTEQDKAENKRQEVTIKKQQKGLGEFF